MRIDITQFSRVVDGIYEAALQPTQWPIALSGIAGLFEVDKALLFTAQLRPRQGGFAFLHGLTEHSLQAWVSKYIEHDIWTRETVAKGFMRDGAVVLDHELCSDEALTSSLYYREFLVEQDIRYLCAGVVFGLESAPYPVTGLSLYKGHGAGKFNLQDRQVVTLLVGHLSRALGTMFRLSDLEMQVASSYAALNLLRVGVLLVGERGNVVFSNQAARKSFSNSGVTGIGLRAGNPLHDGDGWIYLRESAQQRTLDDAIKVAIMHDPMAAAHLTTGMRVPSKTCDQAITLQIAPLAAQNEFSVSNQHVCAIIFMNDSRTRFELDRNALRSLYNLTDAEMGVAHVLLQAESLRDVASQLGISENTVKKHVQALFYKTQTNRQAELIRLLLSLPKRC
jgi:DNA-binding NarL/FixJ family response regulator